jgi:hypothetical protein
MIQLEKYAKQNNLEDLATVSYIAQRCSALYVSSIQFIPKSMSETVNKYTINSMLLLKASAKIHASKSKRHIAEELIAVSENMGFIADKYTQMSKINYRLQGMYISDFMQSDLNFCKLFTTSLPAQFYE